MAQRIVLKGKSLDDIAARVREEHGPRARIVAAERVTSGGLGIAGLFSKRYVEATVELPEKGRRSAAKPGAQEMPAPAGPAAERAFAPTPAQRVGLAALLADAEGGDEMFAAEAAEPEPAVSTRSNAFAELMDDLAFNGVAPDVAVPVPAPGASVPGAAQQQAFPTRAARRAAAAAAASAPRPIAPALLEGPGDLVVIVGERPDTVAVAQAMADGSTRTRAAIRVAGSCADGRFVAITDRRGALEARASGVEMDRATIVAVGWDSTAAGVVEDLAPDQIWFVVDAGRKPADTERWIAQASAVIDADGIAAAGLATTSTPDTVRQLGLPLGWVDA